MSEEHNGKCGDGCGCGNGEPCDCEMEIVELEDENGEKEEFAILDELDFEDRHFLILAPLVEVQAIHDAGGNGEEHGDMDLNIDIYESVDDEIIPVEDENLAHRLMEHLDKLSEESEELED
jgi:hypothetical protein